MSMNCCPDSSCKRTGPCKPILHHRQPPQVSYRPKDRNNSPKLYRHSCSVTGDVYDKVEVLAAISRSCSERSHVRLAASKCPDCPVFRPRSGSGRDDVRFATDLTGSVPSARDFFLAVFQINFLDIKSLCYLCSLIIRYLDSGTSQSYSKRSEYHGGSDF